MLFAVEGLGRFRVRDGERVIVDSDPHATPDEVDGLLLGSVTVALAWQRGLLVLHGAAVAIDGQAVLFVGPPGCGKSSLAVALVGLGHPLVTDDVCAVAFDPEGVPTVQPGTPFVRVWSDVLPTLGLDPGALRRIDTRATDPAGRQKYFVDAAQPATQPLPLARIYQVLPGKDATLSITPVNPSLRLSTLVSATYHREIGDEIGGRDAYFERITALARTTPLFRLRRPADATRLREVARTVEVDVRGAKP
nr:hypothetical protein [Propionibacterium sp.]